LNNFRRRWIEDDNHPDLFVISAFWEKFAIQFLQQNLSPICKLIVAKCCLLFAQLVRRKKLLNLFVWQSLECMLVKLTPGDKGASHPSQCDVTWRVLLIGQNNKTKNQKIKKSLSINYYWKFGCMISDFFMSSVEQKLHFFYTNSKQSKYVHGRKILLIETQNVSDFEIIIASTINCSICIAAKCHLMISQELWFVISLTKND